MNGPCPNCGYCPECGRGAPLLPQGPVWIGNDPTVRWDVVDDRQATYRNHA